MFTYLIKRLLAAVPIALAVTALCFSLVYLAPGDPLSAVLPADASKEMVDAVKARYGLDKPVLHQYGLWLARAMQGDLGQSISTGRSVSLEIGSAIGNSILLALVASALGLSIGGLLGVVAGYLHGTPADRFLSALAIAGVSIPHYWLGIVLVAIFAVQLNMLPAMGAGPGPEWCAMDPAVLVAGSDPAGMAGYPQQCPRLGRSDASGRSPMDRSVAGQLADGRGGPCLGWSGGGGSGTGFPLAGQGVGAVAAAAQCPLDGRVGRFGGGG